VLANRRIARRDPVSDPPKLRDFHLKPTEVEQAFEKCHAEAAAALHGAGTDATAVAGHDSRNPDG